MYRVLPRPEDLNLEEIEHELRVRNVGKEVLSLDLAGKQRHLRNLFKSDKVGRMDYPSNTSILEEVEHISSKIDRLEDALQRRVEPKHESRILHYWYRTKRSFAKDLREQGVKKELIRKIEKIMERFQFGPNASPSKDYVNLHLRLAEEEREEPGTSPKHLKGKDEEQNNPSGGQMYSGDPLGEGPSTIKRTTLEENMQLKSAERSKGIARKGAVRDNIATEVIEPSGKINGSVPRSISPDVVGEIVRGFETMHRTMVNLPEAMMRSMVAHIDSRLQEAEGRWSNQFEHLRQSGAGGTQSRRSRRGQERVASSSDEDRPSASRWGYRKRRDTGSPSESDGATSDGGYTDRGSERPSRNRGQNGCSRVEKWKIRFSGEPRSMPVENFLYKTKKLAEREGLTQARLLRDIHMLLEGPASDWFFTFVDELSTWERFETKITYRFGNPNKDQGIRSKMQERKQMRGESFIAFVTEIEKLNRMLSRPLSNRRKYELVWDNMRQHYRSKIAIINVQDLDHLIEINHKIDAADPQLNPPYQPESGRQRQINQLSTHFSDNERLDDEEAPLNQIRQLAREQPARNRTSGDAQDTSTEMAPSRSCWNCGEAGHGWKQCRKPKRIFCYGCGKLGWTMRSCESCQGVRPYGRTGQGNAQRDGRGGARTFR